MVSKALRIAPSTALLSWQGIHTVEQIRSAYPALTPEKVGLWFAAAPLADPLAPATLLSAHAPLVGNAQAAAALTSFAPDAAIVLDAVMRDVDAEVEDAEALLGAEDAQEGDRVNLFV